MSAPDVAALFVQTLGVYADAPGVDVWDEQRDARLYRGPCPVVAHPPCARWSRLAHATEAQFGYKRGDDGGCFESALASVRAFGGVLEHPAHSKAWARFGLPKPTWHGGWTRSLTDDGWSCYVEQGRYGLPLRKGTWLYAFGVELPELRWGYTPDAEEPGRRGDRRGMDAWRAAWHSGITAHLFFKSHRHDGLRSATPPEFRDELLGMARSAHVGACLA